MKKNQIEEMARTICPCIYNHNDCESCDLYEDERCLPFNIATALYEKNCRIVFEDYQKQCTCYVLECQMAEQLKREVARAIFNDIENVFGGRHGLWLHSTPGQYADYEKIKNKHTDGIKDIPSHSRFETKVLSVMLNIKNLEENDGN